MGAGRDGWRMGGGDGRMRMRVHGGCPPLRQCPSAHPGDRTDASSRAPTQGVDARAERSAGQGTMLGRVGGRRIAANLEEKQIDRHVIPAWHSRPSFEDRGTGRPDLALAPSLSRCTSKRPCSLSLLTAPSHHSLSLYISPFVSVPAASLSIAVSGSLTSRPRSSRRAALPPLLARRNHGVGSRERTWPGCARACARRDRIPRPASRSCMCAHTCSWRCATCSLRATARWSLAWGTAPGARSTSAASRRTPARRTPTPPRSRRTSRPPLPPPHRTREVRVLLENGRMGSGGAPC